MRSRYLATALWVSCGFSVCASAESTQYATVFADPDVPAKVVRYSDLNLGHNEGVAVLYRRIQVAAKGVCAQMNERLPQVRQRARVCALEATSRAVADVGLAALSTLHAAKMEKDSAAPILTARQAR